MRDSWVPVHCPIEPTDILPAERKVVAVWIRGRYLPQCGYIRYAAGDKDCPYFVAYHGNPSIGAEIVAWCDCLPEKGPNIPEAGMFSSDQATGRGFPARSLTPSAPSAIGG